MQGSAAHLDLSHSGSAPHVWFSFRRFFFLQVLGPGPYPNAWIVGHLYGLVLGPVFDSCLGVWSYFIGI